MRRKNILLIIVQIISLIVLPYKIFPQSSADSLNDEAFSSLVKEIINIKPDYDLSDKVSITNLSQINSNEAPGIVYVITSKDIEKNGYRDLLDVFMDVPGFNVANDVYSATSLSLRGFWAQEAKILFMMDGMPLNDMSFGTFTFFGHLSLVSIDRIEIIKGSGSSIYGGMAGLGVVNIITKSGKKSNGSTYQINSGISNQAISRSSGSFHYGTYLLNGLDVSATGSIFGGNRSNQVITLPDSSIISFRDSSLVNNISVNLKLKYKGLEYRIFYDDYNFQDAYEPVTCLYRTFINEIKYNLSLKKLNITPFIQYKNQVPWNTQYGDPQVYEKNNLKTYRTNFGINSNLSLSNFFEITSGVEFYKELSIQQRNRVSISDGPKLDYNAIGAFIEGQIKTKYALLFLGARLDKYGFYKNNYSPRISITKNFSKWNYKLIFGKSFKIPTLQNINLSENRSIQPEIFKDIQLEIGFRKKQNEIVLNGFITRSDHIIVYDFNKQTLAEFYVNKGFSEVFGGEVLLKKSIDNFKLKTSYSNYQVLKSNVEDMLVHTEKLNYGNLAIPLHKIVVNLQYEINEKNDLTINYIFQSRKFGQTRINLETDEYGLVKYPMTHNYDFVYQRKNILKFFDLNIGVLNILNTQNFYVYPFKAGHFPVAGMGRELFVQLKVRLQN